MTHDLTFHVIAKAGETDDGKRYLEGIASTTDADLQKERMSENALANMVKDATGLPLTTSHRNELLDEIGEITEAKLVDGKLFIKAELDDENPGALQAWKAIKKGRQVGFSVGGHITASRDSATKGIKRIIDAVTLNHVMLTKNPANPATFGTAIAKSISDLDQTDDNETQGTTMDNLDKSGAKFSAETVGALKDIHDTGDDAIKSKVRGLLGDIAEDILGATPSPDANAGDVVDPVVAGKTNDESPDAITKADIEAAKDDIRKEVTAAITAAFTQLFKSAPQLKGSPNVSLAKSGVLDSETEDAFSKMFAKAIR